MLAFSEAVDERNEVPGAIYWILFDDNASEILAEFVKLAKSLVGQKTPGRQAFQFPSLFSASSRQRWKNEEDAGFYV